MAIAYYIAKRYLFSKKKHNAINIISAISVCGVALATLALVCTLSVFNGFHEMVEGLFTAFDPPLKITASQGKTFQQNDERIEKVLQMTEIETAMPTIEESAMVQYKDKQLMVTIKGVDDSFTQITEIDSILYGRQAFILQEEGVDYGILGMGVASALGTGIQFVDPLPVIAPKQNVHVNIANPGAAFAKGYLYSPGSVFMVNQEKYDAQYILTSLSFARQLFGYRDEVSAMEIKLKPGSNERSVQTKMKELLGDDFQVQNRFEQQADVFRIMEIEKFISYLFLTFILIIATFNVIGSLSMLIVDKQEDAQTLHNLGASHQLIERIFMFEGWLIAAYGALTGIVLGVILCLIQHHFGIISLGNNFIVEAYPVSVHLLDVVLIFITVLAVGAISVIFPVKYMSKRLTQRL
ncbi:MAG: ABC transporter permease [Bacteroidaceae bacterium]|nr:ABC transporter permease [Bacteroidaceae bacterium]